MIKTTVIDPTKVARTAQENSSSVAGLLLMTEALIADKPEKKEHSSMPHTGDMY